MTDDAPEPSPAAPALRRLAQRLVGPATLAKLDALVPDLATGLRAALATVVPLVLAAREDRPELGWMAIGGWIGTLADPGGSRGSRARILAAFTVVGAALVFTCETAHASGARTALLGAALLGAISFSGAMLHAIGSAAGTLGTMLAVVSAVALGRAGAMPARDAMWFAAGGVLAVVLSSIVWPVWTHLPVRRALAKLFRELAAYVVAIERCAAEGAPVGDARWIRVARQHPRRVRDALEAARAMSLAIRARRSGESRVGSNLRVLLGMAESQFLLLVALGSEIEAQGASREDVRARLARVAGEHETIAARVASNAMRSRAPHTPRERGVSDVDTVEHLASLLEAESDGALALAGELDRPIVAEGEDAAAARPSIAIGLDLRRIRDVATRRSPILRHAVRVAVASAFAVIVGAHVSPAHPAWVSVATLAVLQPYAGATVKRAAERVIGTVLGSAAAIAITAMAPGPLTIAAIMFPLSIAAVVTRPRSYRLFTFFLTPIFVLIAMRYPGDWRTALTRAADTIAGGAIALVAVLVFFPRWEERVGTPAAIATMVRAVEAYVEAVRAALDARDAPAAERIADARRAAAVAISEAEGSLERLLAEPLRLGRGSGTADPSRAMERAMEIVTYCRRLALAASTLDTLASRRVKRADPAIRAGLGRIERFESLVQRAAVPNPVDA